MLLSELFKKCAWEVKYENIGDDVSYAMIEENKVLFIYFQGSVGWKDWLLNFLFKKRVYKEFKVHRGFYHAYSQVRNIILDKVYNNNYKQIIVVGYSHGGALCTLALEDLVWHFPNKNIVGYAFESPRVVSVKKELLDRWENLFRIVDGTDIVTRVPLKIFGYSDVGEEIYIQGNYELVENKLPRCVKYHYPQVVLSGLEDQML